MIRKESFEPVYTDLHIHTSENPNKIKDGVEYDIDALMKNINKISCEKKKLISFTDHNIINKKIYLNKLPDMYYLILGAELHVSYDTKKKPYHCHIFFNVEINGDNIDKINEKLDMLYPKKEIDKEDYKDIPKLEEIINTFNDYDFILLPHGGQNHSTFDKAMPKGIKFDNVMEKVLYYNQFDGFTARTTSGKEKTKNYFKKLGIDEFTNLITCSDNYSPTKYPNPKDDKAEKFIPTWIIAEPTFEGLRISLSESNRLIYSENIPNLYEEYIHGYKIKNDLLDIDVNFKQGLNVIIGESSSGKSLLVDTLVKEINPKLGKIDYSVKYDFDGLVVDNPVGFVPYYINQNFISDVANKNKIEDILLIKQMFGPTEQSKRKTSDKLNKLNNVLANLLNAVDLIEVYQNNLMALTNLDNLILFKSKRENPLEKLFPKENIIDKLDYNEDEYEKHQDYLDEIYKFSKTNIYIEDIKEEIESIKQKLDTAYKKSYFEKYIRKIIKKHKTEFDENYKYDDNEIKTKNSNYEKALLYISKYLEERKKFDKALNELAKFSYKVQSKPIIISGHQLFIENKLEITKNNIIDYINDFLKNDNKITDFEKIKPSDLFLDKLNKSYKIDSYDVFKQKIFSKFTSSNKYDYKIITSDKRKWEELSPGWKTAVLTELILQYGKDEAPLIIDQPEDNLANKYINNKLINDIKKSKTKKQIIIVSHNATIPVLADAENIIYCRANGDSITIRSNYIENKIFDKKCLDIIADITDGGKKSIKKRFKKYNIKTYREENDEI